jgi:hypothetical protein
MTNCPAAPDPIAEVTSLWLALWGEPPPVQASAAVMIEALVSGLREPPIGVFAPSDKGEAC